MAVMWRSLTIQYNRRWQVRPLHSRRDTFSRLDRAGEIVVATTCAAHTNTQLNAGQSTGVQLVSNMQGIKFNSVPVCDDKKWLTQRHRHKRTNISALWHLALMEKLHRRRLRTSYIVAARTVFVICTVFFFFAYVFVRFAGIDASTCINGRVPLVSLHFPRMTNVKCYIFRFSKISHTKYNTKEFGSTRAAQKQIVCGCIQFFLSTWQCCIFI